MSGRLPLQLGPLDHYTLIVEDAAAVARFHTEALGFEHLRVQRVNAGSAPEGEYDMLNHVLQLPGTSRRVLVVTEGLTEGSIFRRYLAAHGPGVHHVAYEVDDLDAALTTLHRHGIRTTSEAVLRDPLTGLRQVFLSREHCGYFVELIERTAAADAGVFTSDNMAALARTMVSYLKGTPASAPPGPLTPATPSVRVAAPRPAVAAFLRDPFNLPRWTAHRTIRRIDGQVVEVRMTGDVRIDVAEREDGVEFRWSRGEGALVVAFALAADEREGGTWVRVGLPPLDEVRRARAAAIIQAELDVLAALLEGRESTIPAETRARIDAYHLEVHQRAGL